MPEELSGPERHNLLEKARAAAENAYAPYSKFCVGAAVVGEHGVYTGANVENASFGLSLCAERSALASAVAAGDRKIRAVAVACIDAEPGGSSGALMPCGACRQWLAELSPDALILVSGVDRIFCTSDLLPDAFTLRAG